MSLKSMTDIATDISNRTARNTEKIILDQLNDFISRGLIILETTRPVNVHSFDSNTIEVKQSCRLVLKDKEYIEELEAKVKKYEDLFKQIGELKDGI